MHEMFGKLGKFSIISVRGEEGVRGGEIICSAPGIYS
jgi:hypothetical protein